MAETHPPRGALLALFLVVFVSMTGFGIVIPIVPFFALHLSASATETTFAIGAYSLGQLIAAPVWGRISDRVGRRPVLVFTLVATGFSYLWLAQADTVGELGVVRFCAGLAAGNIAAAFAAAADLSSAETRARTMGIVGAGLGLGFILGPAIGGLLAGNDPSQSDFSRVCHAAAALAGAAALAALVLLPETRKTRDAGKAEQPARAGALWRRPLLVQLVAVTLLATAAQAVMESTYGLWSERRLGWGPVETGLVFGALGVVAALVQGAGTGRLTARFGEARLLLVGLLLFAVGFVGMALASTPLGAVAATAVLALASGVVTPALQSIVAAQAEAQERGAVLGVQQSASSLGRVVGPALAGPVFDALGPAAPFWCSAALALAAAALAWRSARRQAGLEAEAA